MTIKAQWNLSGGVWTDSSGNAHTLTQAGTVSNATGFLGGANTAASTAGGIGPQLYCADHADFSGLAAFSIAFRYYPTNVSTLQVLQSKAGSSPNLEYAALIGADGKLQFRLSTSGTAWSTILYDSTALTINTWVCVVMQYDGANMYIYVDNMTTARASVAQTGSTYNGTATFSLFSNNDATSAVIGRLDDVQFSNHAMSQADRDSYKGFLENFKQPISVAFTRGANVSSATATVQHPSATISVLRGANTVSVAANVAIPVTGTVAFTRGANSVYATAAVPVLATVAFNRGANTVSAIVTSSVITEPFETKIRHKTTGTPITGLTTVYLRVWQPSTGLYWNFSTNAWAAASVAATIGTMIEVDSTNEAGLYSLTVTTSPWSGWVSSEAYYNDGTFTYCYPGDAYYSFGIRTNGTWSTTEYGLIATLQAGVTNNGVAIATRATPADVPSAVDNAAAVLTAATTTPISANVKKMNDASVTGTGVAGDLWRG